METEEGTMNLITAEEMILSEEQRENKLRKGILGTFL